MDDLQLHAPLLHQQGSRALLNTPVLVLDVDRLDRNIAAMQDRVSARGRSLRPHAKSHKSVDIAHRQIAAGAVGVCCAKIGEAEVLADGGVAGVLITSPVAAAPAIERLAALAVRMPDLAAVVDDQDVARRIDHALAQHGATLDVMIDVDPGLKRTGVASAEAAVALAEVIAASTSMRFCGVQFYCGMEQHIESFADRRAALELRTAYLRTVVASLTEAGFAPGVITGGGTGSHLIDLELGVLTELQCGSYIFMDQQYLDCDLDGSGRAPFETALAVDTRVVSANHHNHVTLDAGFKSLSTDGGQPRALSNAPLDATFAFMGDEHGALASPDIAKGLRPGDAVTLTVPHCDPTVNLYDFYHVVRDTTLVDIWPVSARGRAR